MNIRKIFFACTALALTTVATAQSNNFASGNLHFDAAAMDTNGDHMISKDEFMKYGDAWWSSMSKGAASVGVTQASEDFARGNMRADAAGMDTDHDGSISKDEFMAYEGRQFDSMKNKDGMMSVADVTRNFARGNRP